MIDLAKKAPGLINLAKTAAVSLQKHGLTHERAAVYLVLDHSGSMQRFYANGSVQHLAEQALGLSTNLDDDGTVPIVYFSHRIDEFEEARLDNYAGIIDATHTQVGWGTTDYALAIEYIVKEFGAETTPGLVIFQSDGEPDSPAAAAHALRKASDLPIFWAFIGFGNRIDFLESLDDLPGRAVDNASFFHARDPLAVSDAELYDGITAQYGAWLTAARAAGIIRTR
ncbi:MULTISPECIES: VWA domain-containing protein [Streptomyces griseus group]|uniref:VWA domain-containing protein n=1 Tax=Streptomyces griseus group TaxID=629295 RepID=UPI003651FFCA